MPRRASCSCGQLVLACEGEPVQISMCHCLACQRRTGSVFGVQARFPREAVTIAGRASEFVRIADDGGSVTSYFCPSCGSTVYWTLQVVPGFFGVAVGAFADPGFPEPKFSVYESRRHAWVGIPPNAEHMD